MFYWKEKVIQGFKYNFFPSFHRHKLKSIDLKSNQDMIRMEKGWHNSVHRPSSSMVAFYSNIFIPNLLKYINFYWDPSKKMNETEMYFCVAQTK